MSKLIVVEMNLERSTKGTHVYQSVDSEADVKTLYIKRKALERVPPNNIKLQVEYDG